MPDEQGRTTENELAEAVLTILALRSSGRGEFSDLFRAIPKVVGLTDADLAQSPSRPAEHIWQQRVRNITSHKGAEGNYITEGYLEEIEGGLAITDAGRKRAKKPQR
jgi:hypothetical protein